MPPMLMRLVVLAAIAICASSAIKAQSGGDISPGAAFAMGAPR